MDSATANTDAIRDFIRGVDHTLLRENLKLTPEQRLEKFASFMRFIAELRRAGENVRVWNSLSSVALRASCMVRLARRMTSTLFTLATNETFNGWPVCLRRTILICVRPDWACHSYGIRTQSVAARILLLRRRLVKLPATKLIRRSCRIPSR